MAAAPSNSTPSAGGVVVIERGLGERLGDPDAGDGDAGLASLAGDAASLVFGRVMAEFGRAEAELDGFKAGSACEAELVREGRGWGKDDVADGLDVSRSRGCGGKGESGGGEKGTALHTDYKAAALLG